jgi:hypothetical protein
MRWRSPVAPKITGGRHKTLTEMILPQTVDDHSSGQGIVGVDQPPSESETSLILRSFFRELQRPQDTQCVRDNLFARLKWVSPVQSARRPGLLQLADIPEFADPLQPGEFPLYDLPTFQKLLQLPPLLVRTCRVAIGEGDFHGGPLGQALS